MILSNVEIHKALDEGRLVLTPEPSPRVPSVDNPHCPYDTCSVDLTLSPTVAVPRTGQPFTYDMTDKRKLSPFLSETSEKITLGADQPYRLEQNKFVLGLTREKVGLPIVDDQPSLAGRIEGKSSMARIGMLVHFTAPTVHAGWDGPLTLEIINLGPSTILLNPGMAIAQLILEEVKGTPIENPSQFQAQETPEGERR